MSPWSKSVSLLAMIAWTQSCHAMGDFDQVSSLNESNRIEWVIERLREYSMHLRKSTMSIRVQERGTIQNMNHTSSPNPSESSLAKPEYFNGVLYHELIAHAGKLFLKVQTPTARFLTAFSEGEGKVYWFKPDGSMYQVERICKLPHLQSLSLGSFVTATGIAAFENSSMDKQVDLIRTMTWKGVETDIDLGEVAILDLRQTSSRGESSWTLKFGFREAFLVLLSEEAISQTTVQVAENDTRYNKYILLNQIRYDTKLGGPLPASWTRFVNTESYDPTWSKLLRTNPIQSTTSTISECKFLVRFPDEKFSIPIDRKAVIVDRCQQAMQNAVADEMKNTSNRSGRYWILMLAFGALAVTFYLYRKSKR